MNLIFIHGPAAVGKLTIARELAALTGLRLFHNHLVVDALLAVFPFGSDSFVRLREQIWLDVITDAARQNYSLIFTFTPEPTVSVSFPEVVEQAVQAHGGHVHFVELTSPVEEIESRIENTSRAEFRKLRSLRTLREIRAAETGKPRPMPRADVVVDTSRSSPSDSARHIQVALGLRLNQTSFDPFAS